MSHVERAYSRAHLQAAGDPVDGDANERSEKGALADLIEVERRIEAQLTSAEAEAEQIMVAAQAAVRSGGEGSDGTLEAELEALRASIDRDCEASIRRIDGDAGSEEERYRGVDEGELLELARWLAARLVAGGTRA